MPPSYDLGADPGADPASAQLLATLSHQIRTPLNGVIGMIELLRSTRLDREQARYLDTLNQSAESLLVTLDAALELSTLARARPAPDLSRFSPLQLAQDTTELLRPLAQGKGLQLLLWCDALPDQLLGEPTRLQQLWMNLLSNAIKYTDEGEVRFDLRVLPAPQSGADQVRLSGTISDTGRGIPGEQTARIREAFGHPDQQDLPALIDGLGLGLSIAARLAHRMKGALTIDSEPGLGTRLGFSVLVDVAQASPEGGLSTAQQMAQLAALRVLVAEDNPVHQMLALTLLGRFGIEAHLAQDGAQALARASEQHFDVILMDLEMPVMDGEAATREIRAIRATGATGAMSAIRTNGPMTSEHAPRPWIIAMTARAFDQDRARCRDAGMDDFLSKPFRQDGLLNALLNAIRQRGMLSASPSLRPGPVP